MPAAVRSATVAASVVIVAVEHHGAPPGRGGPAVDIGAHGARPASRPAGRCRRRRSAARWRRPRARRAARRCATGRWRGVCGGGAGQVVGDALDGAVDAVVVDAEDGGARQQRHVRHGGEFGRRAPRPTPPPGGPRWRGVSASRRPPSRKSSSARITRAPARAGGQRRHQAGRAGADDQHVAMQRGAFS